MASLITEMAPLKKPGEVRLGEPPKPASLTEQSPDQPVKLGHAAQVEIYSSMGRSRTGLWYSARGNFRSPEIWGDRKFAEDDRVHPNAKPQDGGRNPGY